MNTIDSIIIELKKFSADLVQLKEPINDNRIIEFEKKYKLHLPLEYKKFMLITNGISSRGIELLPFLSEKPNYFSVEYFHKELKKYLPENFVPISPDGAGNYYCLDLSKQISNTCPVVFWQANYQYSESDRPDIDTDSFLDHIKERFIDLVLEDYQYNGKKK